MCATVAVLLLAGCSSSAAPAAQQPARTVLPDVPVATAQTTFTIDGSIAAQPPDSAHSACDTYRLENAPVVVRDEHGTVLAATQAGANVRPVPTPYPTSGPDEPGLHGKPRPTDTLAYFTAVNACLVRFTATVPRAAFYQVTIGTHAGTPYSFDQIQAAGWILALSLN